MQPIINLLQASENLFKFISFILRTIVFNKEILKYLPIPLVMLMFEFCDQYEFLLSKIGLVAYEMRAKKKLEFSSIHCLIELQGDRPMKIKVKSIANSLT